jgi:hypothetical protein
VCVVFCLAFHFFTACLPFRGGEHVPKSAGLVCLVVAVWVVRIVLWRVVVYPSLMCHGWTGPHLLESRVSWVLALVELCIARGRYGTGLSCAWRWRYACCWGLLVYVCCF